MATRGDEMEVLGRGTKAGSLDRGAFVLNMLRRNGSLEVRHGFGQIGQFDTTVARENTFNADNAYGYREILGSYALETDFGHVQIITLLAGMLWTGNIETRGKNAKCYLLSIFDTTTGARWEELLHDHTSQNDPDMLAMPLWHATFETNRDRDYSSIPSPPHELATQDNFTLNLTDDHSTFFCEFQGALLFGNPDMGLWTYVPADFLGSRPQQLDGTRPLNNARPYGESSRCFRVVSGPGPSVDKYDYLTSAGFPSPSDCTVWFNRLVIASGRTIYMTDSGWPGSIVAGNSVDVPTAGRVTAIAECNGGILAWTDKFETFQIQVGDGAFPLTNCRIQAISTAVGCLAPALRTRMRNTVVWADANGLYQSSGQFDVKKLSEDVECFFEDGLSNPLSDYYRASGAINPAAQSRPSTFLSFADTRGANLCYHGKDDLLLLSVPARNAALVLQGQDWLVWTFDTLTRTATPTLANLRLSSADDRLYAVGGIDIKDITNPFGGGENTSTASYYILRWGDGGSIDRTCEVPQDNREFIGYYTEVGNPLDLPFFVLEKPVRLPVGYQTAYGTAVASGQEVYAFPLYLDLNGLTFDVSEITLDFSFAGWGGVVNNVNPGQMAAMFPPQRIASRDGWGVSAVPPAAPGTNEIVLRDGAGNPDNTATNLYCRFTGLVVGSWDLAPYLSIEYEEEAPLMYLLFRKPAGLISPTSLNISSVTATIGDGVNTVSCRLIWWHQPSVDLRRIQTSDANAQCIDWANKSEILQTKNGDQVKARGLYLHMLSHGAGQSIVGNTTHGQLNAVCASDGKDWTSQILDYQDDIELVNDKTDLRSRFRGLTSNATISQRVFGSNNPEPPRWGDGAVPASGNFLVDDEQVDTIAISDSVRGESVTWMVFGHLRNRAERLVLDSIRAVLRIVGGRRRIGR